jgi:phage antirepressor YoqD-like protein
VYVPIVNNVSTRGTALLHLMVQAATTMYTSDSCSKQSYYDLIFDLVVNTCTIQLNRTYAYIFYKSNTKSTCNEFMHQRKILHQNDNSTFRASMQMGHLDVQTTAISTSQFHKPKGQQDAGIMANKYTVC